MQTVASRRDSIAGRMWTNVKKNANGHTHTNLSRHLPKNYFGINQILTPAATIWQKAIVPSRKLLTDLYGKFEWNRCSQIDLNRLSQNQEINGIDWVGCSKRNYELCVLYKKLACAIIGGSLLLILFATQNPGKEQKKIDIHYVSFLSS